MDFKDYVKKGKITRGINDKEIEDLKKFVWDSYFKRNNMELNSIRIADKGLTKEEDNLLNEISCIEMINSCYCYRDNFKKWNKMYIEDLGTLRVEELYNLQIKKLKTVEVVGNVYTDFERYKL